VYSIAGPIAGTAVALLACVDVAITASRGGVSFGTTVELATTVLTATWFALACCWLYWRALRLEIGSADRCAREYGEATRHRYRLMTTFFHDQGNLLMPLGLIAGSRDVPDAVATLREISDRMIALLDAVESIDESDAAIDGANASISVGRIFDDIRLLFGARAESKGQRLVLEGDRALYVRALPAVLVDSVLSNLVSNAIKFTAPGGTVRISATSASDDRVALTVRDDGPGIPSAVLVRLDRAERLPSTKGTAGEEGHGFGLLLARDFAQRMGGRFRIGRGARGSEVVVDLPRYAGVVAGVA
jgi:signal transduction histidine kinase